MKLLYLCVTFALFSCLFSTFERPALAYVDPGSGLFLFQSLSSIGVGAMFFLRRRIRTLLRRKPGIDPLLRTEEASRSTKTEAVAAQTSKAA